MAQTTPGPTPRGIMEAFKLSEICRKLIFCFCQISSPVNVPLCTFITNHTCTYPPLILFLKNLRKQLNAVET